MMNNLDISLADHTDPPLSAPSGQQTQSMNSRHSSKPKTAFTLHDIEEKYERKESSGADKGSAEGNRRPLSRKKKSLFLKRMASWGRQNMKPTSEPVLQELQIRPVSKNKRRHPAETKMISE